LFLSQAFSARGKQFLPGKKSGNIIRVMHFSFFSRLAEFWKIAAKIKIDLRISVKSRLESE